MGTWVGASLPGHAGLGARCSGWRVRGHVLADPTVTVVLVEACVCALVVGLFAQLVATNPAATQPRERRPSEASVAPRRAPDFV
jgi:hypothetical protein